MAGTFTRSMVVDEELIKNWDFLLLDIKENNPKNCLTYLKNWTLDTGVDMDSIDLW